MWLKSTLGAEGNAALVGTFTVDDSVDMTYLPPIFYEIGKYKQATCQVFPRWRVRSVELGGL